MLIQAYGLFWHRDAVDWNPGAGKGKAFRVLGRRGKNVGTIQIIDIRDQPGIYVLHGHFGAHYVGLSGDRGIGNRLKDHDSDKHSDKWDKFSWFGLRPVTTKVDADGIVECGAFNELMALKSTDAIGDLEALLIELLGTHGQNKQKFKVAKEWIQVKSEEADELLERTKS